MPVGSSDCTAKIHDMGGCMCAFLGSDRHRVADMQLCSPTHQWRFTNYGHARVRTFPYLYLCRGVQPGAGIEQIAGTPVKGKLVEPFRAGFDPSGNLYICEYQGRRITREGPDKVEQRFAGTGVKGFSGDGGPTSRPSTFGCAQSVPSPPGTASRLWKLVDSFGQACSACPQPPDIIAPRMHRSDEIRVFHILENAQSQDWICSPNGRVSGPYSSQSNSAGATRLTRIGSSSHARCRTA
jgi:hypothetical protein